MECSVCNTRSEVDSCATCHALLCEVCGETCERCGEMACPTHTKKTSSGHVLCTKCYEERRARKAAKHQAQEGGTGFQDLEGRRGRIQEEEQEEHRALTASARRITPPWKLCLYTSITGIVFVLFLLIFPSFRRVSLGAASYFPTSLCVLFLAVLASFWGAMGLMNTDPKEQENRGRCLTGLGLAVVSAILAFVAIATDPAKALDEQRRAEELMRQQMNQEQIDENRENALQKYMQ